MWDCTDGTQQMCLVMPPKTQSIPVYSG